MKVLIVGLGSIAHKHIAALRQLYKEPDKELTIYALRSGEKKDAVEGVINIYDLRDLPALPDFVLLSNPTHLHLSAMESCITLGRPLMIEKPLTDGAGYRNIDVLAGEIEVKKIPAYVACNLRFHPAIRFLKEQLGGKRINEVNIYCGSWLPGLRPGRDFRTFYSVDPSAGGGVHLDLVHEIDYCCWLFGEPEKVSAARTHRSSLSIAAADYAHYHLLYKEFSVAITLNYYRVDPKRQIEILFEDATWTVDLLTCSICDQRGERIFSVEEYSIMDTYREQMKYFISHISSGQPMMNSVRESAGILKLCLADE